MQTCTNGLLGTSNQVMIVDDDPQILRLLGAILENEGARVDLELDPRQALERLRGKPTDVLFTDLHMSGCDGFEVIREARKMQPGIATVVITGYGTVDSSVDAFRLGAVDFLTKPFRAEHVAGALGRAAASTAKQRDRAAEARSRYLHREPRTPTTIVACSPAMKRVTEFARRVAAADVPVLVTGEVGAGKEAVVRLIHSLSPQCNGPVVKINCEAVSENLIAEIVFGKESSSGEIQRGAIERAAGGILFLHRVANLPKWMQAELVHAIREQQFLRQGGSTSIPLSARIVATSPQDLRLLVQQGSFVDDLHAFLNVAPIHVPPLRERREDIRPLVTSLMQDVECMELLRDRRQKIEFTEEALTLLERYDWPGNIYELGNFIRRAIVFAADPKISAARVSEFLPPVRPAVGTDMISVPFMGDLKHMERALVTEVINRSHGNKSAAARTLGLHRKSLYRIIENADGDSEEKV